MLIFNSVNFLGKHFSVSADRSCAKIDPCTLVDSQDITLLQDPLAGLQHDETPCKNFNFQDSNKVCNGVEVSIRLLPPSKAKPETAGKFHNLDPDPFRIHVHLSSPKIRRRRKLLLKKGIRVLSILIAIIPLVYVKLSISTS